MKLKLIFLVLFLIFYLAKSSLGQQNTDTISPIDVFNMSIDELLAVKIKVSTTLPTNVFESPSTVSVIDRDMINQYNFASVAEAVRQVSGIDILQTVIDKNVPTIRGILQNFYANKVLIMINNIPVWNPTYGNSTLDRININDVDRIEVLKGPASVLYGTNAYNGVINIILRNVDATNLHAQVDAGIPNMGSAAVNYGERKGDFSWNISGSGSVEVKNPYLFKGGADTLKIGNDFLYADDTLYYYTEELRRKTFNIDLKYKSHSIFANNFINSYTHPGVNATYQSGANRTITDKGSLISYAFDHNLSEKTHVRFNTYFDYHSRDQIMSQAVPISARFSSYRLAASVKINHNFNERLKVEIGAEIFDGVNMGHEIIALEPDTVLRVNIPANKDIIEGSVLGQVNYNYKWFELLAGGRYTHNTGFGSDLSPRIMALFSINKNNKLKLAYGQSFRTPNLLELYFDHPTVVGNQNLLPEKSKSIELIYLTKTQKFFGQINAYYSQYSNLIQRVRTSTNINIPASYENADDFAGFGVETELRYQHPKIINAFINYNYMKGSEEGYEGNFKFVPINTLAMGLNKPIKQFFISTNIFTYTKTQGPWEEIPAQLLWDGHIGYKTSSKKGFNIIHTLSIKNISNSDMLIPEYIRNRPGVNSLATTGFGRSIVYSLKLKF